ncbi:MAG: TolC family protein [Verrucomicrobia bacterium]|nr:TolC family protein [Verrucomicrobiota bacterium]
MLTYSKSIGGLLAVSLLLAGCKGISRKTERQARSDLEAIRERYRPEARPPALPALTEDSPLPAFLTYAMLNQPSVEAAYYDWVAAVEQITSARSLPDPRLMFQTDIQSVVMALMPGLMQELPGPGKLGLRADQASAESSVKYFQFESQVLQAAFEVKKSYYMLFFLEDKIGINREMLTLLSDLELLARTQNEVGKVTLQDVLRAQIEQERLKTEIANLEDSRNPLLAQMKAALGMSVEATNPPMPKEFESTFLDLNSDQLFATALRLNPQLKAMEADVRMAQAGIQLARKARVPDFNVGIESNLKASPAIWMPQAGMTLPIWRDKIAADIAAAQARKEAASARLSAEQIALAVAFADQMFGYRESGRNLELLRNRLIPKARQSLDVARGGYLAGRIDFFNLLDAERTWLEFRLAEVDARTQRELVLADLSLLILGSPPPNAPLLRGSNKLNTSLNN